MTAITGRTYPVRRELRAMGGTWDAAKQAWYVPADRAEEARTLVAETGLARHNAGRRDRQDLRARRKSREWARAAR